MTTTHSRAHFAARRAARAVAPWLVPLVLVLAWEFAARAGALSSRVLPEPLAVVRAAWALVGWGDMWAHV